MINKRTSILLFIIMAIPQSGFSLAQPLNQAYLNKIPYLTRLIAGYKQQNNQPPQQPHRLRPLVWATAASGALLMAYIYFRPQSPTLTPATPPTFTSDTQNLPSTPRLDPAVQQQLRTSITGLDGSIPALENAFSAGHAVIEKQKNLGKLLGPRLPTRQATTPRE